MITVSEAESLILRAIPLAPAVEVPLEQAHGEILREPIVADRPFPPYDRVAMDGIAFAYATWQRGVRAFAVAGIQRAGEPARTLNDPAHCLEVMTGAVLPEGCDCVVPVEQITRNGLSATLFDDCAPAPMQHVHRKGSDRAAGAALLSVGTRLDGPQIAVAATVGRHRLAVAARPRIALISTGDEIIPVDALPLAHQVRRSNGPAMRAALASAGFVNVDVAHVADDPDVMSRQVAAALRDADFIMLSGGVSEGRYDHVPDVLTALGVQAHFHKVRQRPGLPLWFGKGPGGQAIFGLPGNPVSAVVCLYRYVLPALWAHLGATLRAPAERPRVKLADAVSMKKPLTLFLPVRVWDNDDGVQLARPVPLNGSGDLAGLATSDGVVELAGGGREFAAGEVHPVWLWGNPWGLLKQPE